MRHTYYLLVFVMCSCTPPVVFDQPYPTDSEDLSAIPEAYQGTYICESDSTLVVITGTDITTRLTKVFSTTVKHVEESEECKIIEDTLYMKGRVECIPLVYISDTVVIGTVIERDTLFVMQEGSVARLYGSHLVLSQEMKPSHWAVSLLSSQVGGDLIYKAVTDRTSIDEVSKITKPETVTTETDTKARYRIRPTMTEFDALLEREDVFIECDYLSRGDLELPFLD